MRDVRSVPEQQMLRYRLSTNGAWLGNMHAVAQRFPTNTRGPPLIVPFSEITARLRAKSLLGQLVGIQPNRQHTQSLDSLVPYVHGNTLTTFVMHQFVLVSKEERGRRRCECVIRNQRHLQVR